MLDHQNAVKAFDMELFFKLFLFMFLYAPYHSEGPIQCGWGFYLLTSWHK